MFPVVPGNGNQILNRLDLSSERPVFDSAIGGVVLIYIYVYVCVGVSILESHM